MIKVTVNIYGNYRGLVTGKGWTQLGGNDYDAIAWASEQLEQYPSEKLSLASDVTMEQVRKYREGLARIIRK
jgi:hypothetical protein